MQDSDAVDEAEAATWADAIVDAIKKPLSDDGEWIPFGSVELKSSKSPLFKWDSEDGRDCFINLEQVSMVTMLHGNSEVEYKLMLKLAGFDASIGTDNPETIDRFWAEWEVL